MVQVQVRVRVQVQVRVRVRGQDQEMMGHAMKVVVIYLITVMDVQM